MEDDGWCHSCLVFSVGGFENVWGIFDIRLNQQLSLAIYAWLPANKNTQSHMHLSQANANDAVRLRLIEIKQTSWHKRTEFFRRLMMSLDVQLRVEIDE